MSSVGKRWEIGADACVIYQPYEGSESPMLFLAAGSNSVVLVPPADRDEYPDFVRFLRDLSEAAQELALDCHPASPWGNEVFADLFNKPFGRRVQ